MARVCYHTYTPKIVNNSRLQQRADCVIYDSSLHMYSFIFTQVQMLSTSLTIFFILSIIMVWARRDDIYIILCMAFKSISSSSVDFLHYITISKDHHIHALTVTLLLLLLSIIHCWYKPQSTNVHLINHSFPLFGGSTILYCWNPKHRISVWQQILGKHCIYVPWSVVHQPRKWAIQRKTKLCMGAWNPSTL